MYQTLREFTDIPTNTVKITDMPVAREITDIPTPPIYIGVSVCR